MHKEKIFRTPSKWRQQQNQKSTLQHPGHDDVKKIKAYIKHNVSDEEIKKTFNISDLILRKIKRNIYNIHEPNKTIFPKLESTIIIQNQIDLGFDKLDIIIDFNLSEETYNKILKGTYKYSTRIKNHE